MPPKSKLKLWCLALAPFLSVFPVVILLVALYDKYNWPTAILYTLCAVYAVLSFIVMRHISKKDANIVTLLMFPNPSPDGSPLPQPRWPQYLKLTLFIILYFPIMGFIALLLCHILIND
ncbi:MAG: hypothetical protein JW936_02495 [Sedimentisphaerales bacterium]|nr:hypothetical protein [Sedimentisphaerales bacterium]